MGRPPKRLEPEHVVKTFLASGKSMSKTRDALGVHSGRIIPILMRRRLYTPRRTPAQSRSYVRASTSQTPATIRDVASKIVSPSSSSVASVSPHKLFELMRRPTREGRVVLDKIHEGAETITYAEAAALLRANKSNLHRQLRAIRASPGRFQDVIPLPQHPKRSGKIDAQAFLNSSYQNFLKTITQTEATELNSRLLRITPGAADNLFPHLQRVPTHLQKGGYGAEEYLQALGSKLEQRRVGRYGNQVEQVLKAWSTAPDKLSVKPNSAIAWHVPANLREGRFFMSNDVLLHTNTSRLRTHRQAVASRPDYRPGPSGKKQPALEQDRAALERALGLDPKMPIILGGRRTTLLDAMTNKDRIALGKTISDLMGSGKVPMHLPVLEGPERRRANKSIALAMSANASPLLRKVASILQGKPTITPEEDKAQAGLERERAAKAALNRRRAAWAVKMAATKRPRDIPQEAIRVIRQLPRGSVSKTVESANLYKNIFKRIGIAERVGAKSPSELEIPSGMPLSKRERQGRVLKSEIARLDSDLHAIRKGNGEQLKAKYSGEFADDPQAMRELAEIARIQDFSLAEAMILRLRSKKQQTLIDIGAAETVDSSAPAEGSRVDVHY